MSYQGYIDSIGGQVIRGWAFNAELPSEQLVIEILSDNLNIGETTASIYRADLMHSNIGDDHHAFEFNIPDRFWGTELTARVSGTDFFLINNQEFKHKLFLEMFTQSTMKGLPSATYGFTTESVSKVDLDISSEIIQIWKAMTKVSEGSSNLIGTDNMWEIHKDINQSDFLTLLENEDKKGLATYLVQLPGQKISHGFLQGEDASQALRSATPPGLERIATSHLDSFISLAESLGVSFMESPEQGDSGNTLHADPVPILREINDILGVDITPPTPFDGLFGTSINGDMYSRRDTQALYTALSILNALSEKTNVSVCEIGGGAGMSAYYASLLGIKKYTLIDLPLICLVQYYYLKKSLPDKVIWMQGNPGNSNDADIIILSADMFPDNSIGPFDLVVNVDSFPEMGDEVCSSYFQQLPQKTKLLLSINQEANKPLTDNPQGPKQTIVPRLISNQTNFKRLSRQKSWVRKGYAVELYSVAPDNAD